MGIFRGFGFGPFGRKYPQYFFLFTFGKLYRLYSFNNATVMCFWFRWAFRSCYMLFRSWYHSLWKVFFGFVFFLRLLCHLFFNSACRFTSKSFEMVAISWSMICHRMLVMEHAEPRRTFHNQAMIFLL